ncbi:MAG: hypothetical protein AB7I27_00490 [Bacteriovoracaceae bacterium]
MTTAITTSSIQKIEELLVTGNLAQFSNQERVAYVNKVCDTLGLNPLTRPFEFVTFQGKMVMYAKKDCTDQLRRIHGVSIRVTKQEILDGLLFVTVEATDKTGRIDSDVGVLNISGLKGDALANASMKALTKAKRRVTLSICGLGILDETELETTPGAPHMDTVTNGEIPTEKTFANIRALLTAKGKTEEGLLSYLSTQSGGQAIEKLEDMNAAQVEYAYRILGGSK